MFGFVRLYDYDNKPNGKFQIISNNIIFILICQVIVHVIGYMLSGIVCLFSHTTLSRFWTGSATLSAAEEVLDITCGFFRNPGNPYISVSGFDIPSFKFQVDLDVA